VTCLVRPVLFLTFFLSVRPFGTHAQTTASDLDDYYRAVGEHFDVGRDEVRIISAWNLEPEDVSVVFFLANGAGISADAVAAERSRGGSWSGLMRRFGIHVSTIHISFQEDSVLGGLTSLYARMGRTPRSGWDRLDLTDGEVAALINIRMWSSALDVAPAAIVQAFEASGSFIAVQRFLVGR